jgi:two-component system, LytTR family, sensor kinase
MKKKINFTMMKAISLETILDQRKWYSHAVILGVSLLGLFYYVITNRLPLHPSNLLTFIGVIISYLETFIFLASRIFRRQGPETTTRAFLKNILSRFLLFMVACYASAMIIFILFHLFYDLRMAVVIYNFFHFEFASWSKSTLTGLVFGSVIFLYTQWIDALKRERKLKEESLIFQNETLKNQVNPHFLFNSLNTLSSLITSKPEAAEEFINKLSSIYRYIIENSPKDLVPLQSELAFIGDYFELNKIRDEEKIKLIVNTPDAENYSILPVSLQILLENAVKHNMATRESPLEISIYIENQHIVVKNNLQKMATQLKSTKTGLKNLAERVRLMTGKALIIEETKSDFIVKVPLLS